MIVWYTPQGSKDTQVLCAGQIGIKAGGAMLANVKLLLHDNSPFLSLIIFCMNFKIALGMVAGGANLRGFLTHDDVTAVAALPHLDLAFGEDLRRLYIAQQGAVTLLMVLFDGSDQTETLCQLVETLLIGGFGKAVVHIRPLVVLALSGGEKVFGGVANAVQLFEPQLAGKYQPGNGSEQGLYCGQPSCSPEWIY